MRVALRHLAPVLAGLAALAVYIRTLYPGLVSIGDSPKFQFVGPIWGTPHNPGYPLYLVVSHGFSYLPLGTLAYRMNFMSAVFGAVTVALVAALVRRVTGSAVAGAGAALSFAFGQVFWSQATIAEVYTLASALLAATLLFVIRWTDTRQRRDLMVAAVFVALALGNHLTIVIILPCLVLFVVATDWRASMSARVVLPASLLILAGFAQYLLILQLTARQPAYLESAARNLGELLDVMRGAQFASRLFTADLRTVLAEHNPALFRVLVQEMKPWGLVLAGTGVAILVSRGQWKLAGLVIAASTAVWVFVLNYAVADPQVFLIPIFVILAVPVGVTLAWISSSRVTGGGPRRAVAGVLTLVPAFSLLAGNYRASDHHRRTFETLLFDAIFRAVPDRSAVVPGTFAEHLMLTYKLEGEGIRRSRDIRRAEPDAVTLKRAAAGGYAVFAFPASVDALFRSGLVFEPVQLWDVTLPAFAASADRGTVVVIAGSGFSAALGPQRGPSFPFIGARTALTGQIHRDYAVIGVVGADTGAIEAVGSGATVTLEAGQEIGPGDAWKGPKVEARAEHGGTIWLDGRIAVEAPDAVAVLVLTREGAVLRQTFADPGRQLRIPFEGPPALFRLAATRECRDVGNLGWVDISSIAAGGRIAARIDNYRPFDTLLRFVLWSESLVEPTIRAWQGPGTPAVSMSGLPRAAIERADLPVTAAPDAPFMSLVEIRFNDDGQFVTFDLGFGAPIRAAWVSAAVDLANPRRATLCRGDSM